MNWKALRADVARTGMWLLDGIVTVAFSLGVWILSDLPNAWAAWKWKRQQHRRTDGAMGTSRRD